MQQIEKVERNEKYITFHSLTETRIYELAVYQKHITDYAFKHVCDNCDFEDWSLEAIIDTLDENFMLESFNELFTTQNEGLIKFKGFCRIKSLSFNNVTFYPELAEKRPINGRKRDFKTTIATIEFENGIKGTQRFTKSDKTDCLQVGQEVEFVFTITYGKLISGLRYGLESKFATYNNIAIHEKHFKAVLI